MKNLKIIVASALLASFAFGADAKDVAAKSFELNKQASELMQKLGKICEQKQALMMDATKDMSEAGYQGGLAHRRFFDSILAQSYLYSF